MLSDARSIEMPSPTPTSNLKLPFQTGQFESLVEGLDYAAKGETGFNYYSIRGELKAALTYAELRARALTLARKLVGLGLPRGARVVLIAETIPEFHVFFFACQYAALLPVQLPVPINLGGRDAYVQQLRRMAAACRPAAAMASPDMIGLLRDAVEDLGIPHVGTPDDFERLPESADPRPAGPDDLCYIQYSSGSTSEPKGVVVSQRSATANVRAITVHGLAVRQGDRAASWLPLYHDMGLIGFCISPALSQLSVDYIATSDFARRPLLWLRLISERGGTVGFSPSFGYDLCRRQASGGAGSGRALDLSNWRIAGIGGDMVRPGVLNRFAETFADNGFDPLAFLPSYGLAESTLAVSFPPLGTPLQIDRVDKAALADSGQAVPVADDIAPADARSFVVCGRALPGHEIEIRGESGQRLPDRRVGRILVRGPSVMVGFFDDPDRTAAVLSEDGWLDTGDLGYMIEGALVITGRSKDLIICNGRNIWPQDIEWAVERLPGLRNGDVAAFSIDSAESGEEVVTVVQCRGAVRKEPDKLIHDVAAIVRKSVGVDTKVVLAPVRSLPVTSSGKISRTATRARYLAGQFDAEKV